MMDQAGVFRASVCAVAVSLVSPVYAQDEQPAAAPAEPAAAPAADQQQAQPAPAFSLLVRVMSIRASAK